MRLLFALSYPVFPNNDDSGTAALLVMRCYALYQRKLWILLITVPPALAIIGVSLVKHAVPSTALPLRTNVDVVHSGWRSKMGQKASSLEVFLHVY